MATGIVGGAEQEVKALEGLEAGFLNDDVLALVVDHLACGAGGAEEAEFGDGELAFGEDDSHLFADGARGAENATL